MTALLDRPLVDVLARWQQCVGPVQPNGCALWTRGVGSHGYGVFYPSPSGPGVLAHRWALERKIGRPIGLGLESLHSCDVPLCVADDHLSEGTHEQNMNEAAERGRAWRPSQTIDACVNDHEFTPENTTWSTRRSSNGKVYAVRKCRACNRNYLARRRERKANPSTPERN